MNELITNLKNEKFVYERGELHVSKQHIVINMEPDSLAEGTFLVQSLNGARIHTKVYTSHWRMKCAQREYRGPLAEIGYRFDSTGMTVGDTIRGEISVVSDAGEYTIPFVVTVEREVVNTSEGKIRNMEDFLTLANLHLELAYQAFSHPSFVGTLKNDDPKYLRWYEGLVRERVTYDTMLEFLKLTGYQPDEQERSSLRKELRQAYNRQHVDYARKEYRKKIVEMIRLYTQFRGSQMEVKEFAPAARGLLDELSKYDVNADFYYMMGIHIYILEGELTKAKEKLDEYVDNHYDMQKNQELYGYYLYLCAMLRKSAPFLVQACQRMRVLSVRKPKSVLLLWILLMMDEELLEDPQTKLTLLEKRHYMGVRSPFIYIEAAMMYRQNPEWIEELSPYEVQVLFFAMRHGLLSLDMVHRMATICIKSKDFSPTLYRLLTQCYAQFEDKLLLQAICSLLIKDHKIGEQYFEWYERGVAAELRITRLYDYYLYSVKEDMSHPLNEELLKYFQYNQDIDYRKKAFLFANLYKFRGERSELYQQYKEEMQEFAVSQLGLGRTNRYLVLLYKNIIDRRFVNAKTAPHIADFIFSYWLQDLEEDVVSVVVREPAYKKERVIPVVDHEVVVPVYSTEASVYFQTKNGERRAISDIYQQDRWFDKEELLELCQQFVPDHAGILLGRAENLIQQPGEQWKNDAIALTMVPILSDSFCQEIWQQLLQHFYDEYRVEDALWCLEQIRLEKLPTAVQTYDVELWISQGCYHQAAEYVYRYGCERIDTKLLVRLCSRLIGAKEFSANQELLTLCQYVFLQDKYDEVMLSYLLEHGEGDTKRLLRLWYAGQRFGLDTYLLEERIIKQVLKTGYFKSAVYDVFENYYRNAGKEDVIAAFLTYLSKEVLMYGLEADGRLYIWIGKQLAAGEQLNGTCRLAWLYGLSQESLVDQDTEELAKQVLREFMGQGRYFAFYKELNGKLSFHGVTREKQFVECKANPTSKLFFCYVDDGQGNSYMEEMEQPYPGIFVKECALFAGDELPYYILERRKNEALFVSEGILKYEETEDAGSSRYQKLNALLQKPEEQQALLVQEYLQEEYLARRLFTAKML